MAAPDPVWADGLSEVMRAEDALARTLDRANDQAGAIIAEAQERARARAIDAGADRERRVEEVTREHQRARLEAIRELEARAAAERDRFGALQESQIEALAGEVVEHVLASFARGRAP